MNAIQFNVHITFLQVQNLECKIDIMEEVLAKLREMEIVNKEKNTSQEQIPIRRAEKEQITAKLAEKEVELTRKQNDLNQIGEQVCLLFNSKLGNCL